MTDVQERKQADTASELLLQKTLEITEIKTSEARTFAATLSNLTTIGDDGSSFSNFTTTGDGGSSLDAESSHTSAGHVRGVANGDAKEGEGCTVQ